MRKTLGDICWSCSLCQWDGVRVLFHMVLHIVKSAVGLHTHPHPHTHPPTPPHTHTHTHTHTHILLVLTRKGRTKNASCNKYHWWPLCSDDFWRAAGCRDATLKMLLPSRCYYPTVQIRPANWLPFSHEIDQYSSPSHPNEANKMGHWLKCVLRNGWHKTSYLAFSPNRCIS